MQVITGPRQVGKSTIVEQVLAEIGQAHVFESGDGPGIRNATWIGAVWAEARARSGSEPVILAIDEIQKIPDWSEVVKRLWDEDTRARRDIRVVLLGSSTNISHRGLSESLAGRFERIRVQPWSYAEMRDAFNFTLDEYLLFGGYPGPASLRGDFERWRNYVHDSIIMPALTRDLLQLQRVDKPALLRQLFELGASLSGKVVTYEKLVGRLQDAGNTTTIAHYLSLLEEGGLLCGIQKYSGSVVRRRSSSPKLQVLANATATAYEAPWMTGITDATMGPLVESAVGAHLRNSIDGTPTGLYYWKKGDHEVDFVLTSRTRTLALEVTTSKDHHLRGLDAFHKAYPSAAVALIGPRGISVETVLTSTAQDLLERFT